MIAPFPVSCCVCGGRRRTGSQVRIVSSPQSLSVFSRLRCPSCVAPRKIYPPKVLRRERPR